MPGISVWLNNSAELSQAVDVSDVYGCSSLGKNLPITEKSYTCVEHNVYFG